MDEYDDAERIFNADLHEKLPSEVAEVMRQQAAMMLGTLDDVADSILVMQQDLSNTRTLLKGLLARLVRVKPTIVKPTEDE